MNVKRAFPVNSCGLAFVCTTKTKTRRPEVYDGNGEKEKRETRDVPKRETFFVRPVVVLFLRDVDAAL